MSKRFKLVFIDEDDEWALYDENENKYYDIDLSLYQKEMERIERNHKNLHEKYEELDNKYKKCNRELLKIKGNESSAKRIYENLKECFDGDVE